MSSTGELFLYPTGAGEHTKFARGPIEQYQMGANQTLQWFPDGRRVLFCAKEQASPLRCYENDSPARAVEPRWWRAAGSLYDTLSASTPFAELAGPTIRIPVTMTAAATSIRA